MKRTMYEAARHTPKRGAGSSNLPEDARMPQPAKSAAAFFALANGGNEATVPGRSKKAPAGKNRRRLLVDLEGFEPLTSRMRTERSPN